MMTSALQLATAAVMGGLAVKAAQFLSAKRKAAQDREAELAIMRGNIRTLETFQRNIRRDIQELRRDLSARQSSATPSQENA
jgi:hypothetical protein